MSVAADQEMINTRIYDKFFGPQNGATQHLDADDLAGIGIGRGGLRQKGPDKCLDIPDLLNCIESGDDFVILDSKGVELARFVNYSDISAFKIGEYYLIDATADELGVAVVGAGIYREMAEIPEQPSIDEEKNDPFVDFMMGLPEWLQATIALIFSGVIIGVGIKILADFVSAFRTPSPKREKRVAMIQTGADGWQPLDVVRAKEAAQAEASAVRSAIESAVREVAEKPARDRSEFISWYNTNVAHKERSSNPYGHGARYLEHDDPDIVIQAAMNSVLGGAGRLDPQLDDAGGTPLTRIMGSLLNTYEGAIGQEIRSRLANEIKDKLGRKKGRHVDTPLNSLGTDTDLSDRMN